MLGWFKILLVVIVNIFFIFFFSLDYTTEESIVLNPLDSRLIVPHNLINKRMQMTDNSNGKAISYYFETTPIRLGSRVLTSNHTIRLTNDVTYNSFVTWTMYMHNNAQVMVKMNTNYICKFFVFKGFKNYKNWGKLYKTEYEIYKLESMLNIVFNITQQDDYYLVVENIDNNGTLDGSISFTITQPRFNTENAMGFFEGSWTMNLNWNKKVNLLITNPTDSPIFITINYLSRNIFQLIIIIIQLIFAVVSIYYLVFNSCKESKDTISLLPLINQQTSQNTKSQ